jgi:hypothetical protein
MGLQTTGSRVRFKTTLYERSWRIWLLKDPRPAVLTPARIKKHQKLLHHIRLPELLMARFSLNWQALPRNCQQMLDPIIYFM